MSAAASIVGAIRGLESEGNRVASAFDRIQPDVLGLSLSKEALDAMVKLAALEKVDSGPVNIEEEAYIRGLSAFGKVIKPPPCFSRALEAASKAAARAEPLDMDEEHYTMAYCKHIGTLDMIRQGRSQKLFDGYVFRSETPEEFVIEWDSLVNRLKGYRDLETARESWLAKGICRLADSFSRPLIVIELERLEGVKAELEKAGCAFNIIR